jgi:L-lactate dehydrogenase complex protein LldE
MKVALFVPCYVDAFFPEVAIATLELLERFDVEVAYPLDQTCCAQPMANSGCHQEAAATEALFVRNFRGFDYIVTPSGSCTHHVRDHLTAIPQTPEVSAVRRNTFELVEFLHDILGVREFPWAEFPHKVGLHIGCSTLRASAKRRCRDRRHPSPARRAASAVKGIEFVRRSVPTSAAASAAPSRSTRSRLGADGLRQGQRPPRRRRRAHRSPDMSCVMHQKGCAERLNLPLRFIHIAQVLNGARE